MSTIENLAGAALMVDPEGATLSADEAARLQNLGTRAVCLFRRNVASLESTRALVRDLKRTLGDDLLIAIDQEGGAVMRTQFLPVAPSAMALGAVGDEGLARACGAAVARGLKALGVNLNFAPVVDINVDPKNPVIAERSFGGHPADVIRLARAWMDGHLGEGVACCLKHFPGHGDTHTDSHLDLPVVDKPLETLRMQELLPFSVLMECPALMSAHIRFPALDPDMPATLSKPILQHLLHEQLGFPGVTLTDAMNMEAIRARWGQAEGAVKALAAGADLALIMRHPDEMVAARDALATAVQAGRLERRRLEQARARVAALVARFPIWVVDYTAEQRAADGALFEAAWTRALTAQGKPQRPQPGTRLRLVVQKSAGSDHVSEAGIDARALVDVLGPRFALEVVEYDSRYTFDWASLPRDGVYTVLASTTRRRYGDRERATWQPDLHLALWNPYAAADLATPALVTYGFAPAALAAVACWLSGEIEAAGKSPVAL